MINVNLSRKTNLKLANKGMIRKISDGYRTFPERNMRGTRYIFGSCLQFFYRLVSYHDYSGKISNEDDHYMQERASDFDSKLCLSD